MAQELIYLTAEGYKKLKDELDHLRSVERPAASAAIAEARDKGDLSENAEYDAAREAQGLLEMDRLHSRAFWPGCKNYFDWNLQQVIDQLLLFLQKNHPT